MTLCLLALHLVGPHPPDPLVIRGVASWYDEDSVTATGVRYDPDGMTCAMRPPVRLGATVRVTRRDTGASVVLRCSDRGPYVQGRVVDVSRAAARQLAMLTAGLAPVAVEVER